MINRIFEKLLSVEITFIILDMLLGNFVIIDQLAVSLMIIIIISGTMLLHIVLERIRWQMYLVYVISLVLIGLFVTGFEINSLWLNRLIQIISLVFILVSNILAILLPVFQLPHINKDVSVGVRYLTIESIHLKFFYPSINDKKLVKDRYHPTPTKSLDGIMGAPGFVFSHVKLVKTGAYIDADISKAVTKYPLVIYSHGAMSTYVDNSALLIEIASNGYIVLAIDYDFSFQLYNMNQSDAMSMNLEAQKRFGQELFEKVVPNQVDDISYCLKVLSESNSQLSQAIDFNNIALLGHSLGGTTSVNGSLKIPNVHAVINMDGPIDDKTIPCFHVPLLYMSSFSPDLADEELKAKRVPVDFYRSVKKYELESVYKMMDKKSSDLFWVRLLTAGHLDFTDMPYIVPIMTTRGYNKAKGHQLRSIIINKFLDSYLKQDFKMEKIKDRSLEWLT